ncbi:MAG TPA: transporter [Bryobacteraceae bacterium]|nr:transporter [Bryobacteraceae bacterium]
MRSPNWKSVLACAAFVISAGIAFASDGGGSVYPAGVETVMPGMLPGPGATLFEEFTNFYQANELTGSNGKALLPGFHLRVGAVAPRVLHNWGVHLLGGTLVSAAAFPYVYVHLDAPFGAGSKAGFSNPDLGLAYIAYATGNVHWYYGMDLYTPGFSYTKDALVNIGQHNFADSAVGAFTWRPNRERTEVSSKLQYIFNYTNPATNYRSGNEFVWEFDGMRNVSKTVALGFNGFYDQQTTADTMNGLQYLDGNFGRTMQIGPEIRCHFKHYAMALKYEKDFLTENRPVGNSLWLQFGIPLPSHREE